MCSHHFLSVTGISRRHRSTWTARQPWNRGTNREQTLPIIIYCIHAQTEKLIFVSPTGFPWSSGVSWAARGEGKLFEV